MNRKISSDFTKIFQFVFIGKFLTLSVVFFITLFIFDLKTNLIVITLWVIGLVILRQMGMTKLKTIYWNEQSLKVGNRNSQTIILFADIKNIKRTFLFNDFPFKIKFMESGKVKEVYFLPKSSVFQDFLNENGLIEKLKSEIKKSNANNGYK